MGSDLIGSKIDRDTAFKLFDFYSENGGTFIDTANMYACWLPGCAGGESETTIGAWMKDRRNRDRMVISSKLAFIPASRTCTRAQNGTASQLRSTQPATRLANGNPVSSSYCLTSMYSYPTKWSSKASRVRTTQPPPCALSKTEKL